MYPKKQPIKTQEEWEAIKYKNNVGIQIGACINKATDITIALGTQESVGMSPEKIEKNIKYWTDILFKIGTEKKIKETTPQPVSNEAARQAGIDFNKRYEKYSKLEDIEDQETRTQKEADKREEEGQKHSPDNLPTKKE